MNKYLKPCFVCGGDGSVWVGIDDRNEVETKCKNCDGTGTVFSEDGIELLDFLAHLGLEDRIDILEKKCSLLRSLVAKLKGEQS